MVSFALVAEMRAALHDLPYETDLRLWRKVVIKRTVGDACSYKIFSDSIEKELVL